MCVAHVFGVYSPERQQTPRVVSAGDRVPLENLQRRVNTSDKSHVYIPNEYISYHYHVLSFYVDSSGNATHFHWQHLHQKHGDVVQQRPSDQCLCAAVSLCMWCTPVLEVSTAHDAKGLM